MNCNLLNCNTQHGLRAGGGVVEVVKVVFPAVNTVQRQVALFPTQGSSGLQTGLAPRPLPARFAFVEKSLFDVTERPSLLHDNALHGLLACLPSSLNVFFLLAETENFQESVSHN